MEVLLREASQTKGNLCPARTCLVCLVGVTGGELQVEVVFVVPG